MSDQELTQTYANDSATSSSIDTKLAQPRSADVLRFRIKVPQTLDQAAKLRKWLEQIQHKTPRTARVFVSNLIYAIKATEGEADLRRPEKQAHLAYQAEKLAEASR